MKKISLKIFVSIVFLTNTFMKCHPTEEDVLAEKKNKVVQHNYVLVNSVDNSPAEVEVSYSVWIAGNDENIVKTEHKTTPFVIGGEPVKIVYDSVALTFKGDVKSRYNAVRRDYTSKGADYLSIRNLSGVAIEYAVVGNQPIRYYSAEGLDQIDVGDKNNIPDRNKVVEQSPNPIYKGVPILYLLYPEKAPQTEVSVPWQEGEYHRGLLKITAHHTKLFLLKPPKLGELTISSPFTIEQVLDLYRQESNGTEQLFSSYYRYNLANLSTGYTFYERLQEEDKKIRWYGQILAGDKLENQGDIFFVNTPPKLGGVF